MVTGSFQAGVGAKLYRYSRWPSRSRIGRSSSMVCPSVTVLWSRRQRMEKAKKKPNKKKKTFYPTFFEFVDIQKHFLTVKNNI